MPLSDVVRSHREAKRWSKSELAEMARLSPAEITRLENGERPRASVETLHRLAVAFSGGATMPDYSVWLAGLVAASRESSMTTETEDAAGPAE